MTNAVHGFVGMVTTLLRDRGPGAMAVAFDRPGPTFRDRLVPDYKGTRPAVPEALVTQFDLVRAVLDALGICRLDLDDYEADDILATWATMGRDAGRDVVVVSGDRDTFQLVEDPHVSVLYTRRGLSDTVRYDEAAIEERYGVPPRQYPLLAALRGDPSDNLAGVPGVGEKTAARLAAKYGSLDALFEHLDEQTPKLRENLRVSEAVVRRNAEIIPLVRDVPVGVGLDDLALGRWDVAQVERIFADLELRNAWQRLAPLLLTGDFADSGARTAPTPGAPGHEAASPVGTAGPWISPPATAQGGTWQDPVPMVVVPGSPEEAAERLDALAAGTDVAVLAGRWHGDPGRSPMSGLALAAMPSDAEAVEAVLWIDGRLLAPGAGILAHLAAAVGATGRPVAGHGLKELMRSLLPLEVDVARVDLDTQVASYLLDPALGRDSVGDLARRWSGGRRAPTPGAAQVSLAMSSDRSRAVPAGLLDDPDGGAGMLDDPETGPGETTETGPGETTESGLGAGGRPGGTGEITESGLGAGGRPGGTRVRYSASDAPPDVAREAAVEVATVAALAAPLRQALVDGGLAALDADVERPLVRVLARMEVAGIGVDTDELRRIADDMARQCQVLEAEVQRLAGVPFNVNSTPQLRQVLFGTLGLPPGKKTKTGYSTDAQTLERLRGAHPVVDVLLRYREVEKLRSTYGQTLLSEVAPDGRIHATFHQTVARTGRLSSDRPNLHNIPVRTEEGRMLRRAFVPAPGARLLVADYDQIELRVIAHLAGDPGLLEAFASGRDVHRATAARVFAVAEDAVTTAQRNRAKMVSYGLAYGMEAFGLAQRLGIPTEEAREILGSYFKAFPAIRRYMDEAVSEARRLGYTTTVLGRRRPLPDLASENRGLRQAAERQAMNAAVQGLAADLFKMALVELDRAFEARQSATRLVLQVHDEVVVEVAEAGAEAVGELVRTIMAQVGPAVGLKVPLEVSIGWGTSWADAKR